MTYLQKFKTSKKKRKSKQKLKDYSKFKDRKIKFNLDQAMLNHTQLLLTTILSFLMWMLIFQMMRQTKQRLMTLSQTQTCQARSTQIQMFIQEIYLPNQCFTILLNFTKHLLQGHMCNLYSLKWRTREIKEVYWKFGKDQLSILIKKNTNSNAVCFQITISRCFRSYRISHWMW